MKRILISVPTPGRNLFQWTESTLKLMAKAYTGALNADFGFQASVSHSIHTNREILAQFAVDENFTHLLFLDDDMRFDWQAVDILIRRNLPIVAVNYLMKTRCRSKFVAEDHNGKMIPTTAESKGVQPCHYTGFGVSLIRTDVLKAIPRPWFPPTWIGDTKSGRWVTEDVGFFEKCQEAGYVVHLDHDASKLVSHWGDGEWNWSDYKSGTDTSQSPSAATVG